jgi:MFS family permease
MFGTFDSVTTTLRRARAATYASFVLCGFNLGMWIVHIPAVERRTGIGHAVLGWLLLLLGAGAFTGMQVVGRLNDRFGARVMVPITGVLTSVAVVLPALAVNAWTLGAALVVFGFCNSCLDVSMNVHAIDVERGYGRPVMSSFHAMFSVGGVIAALIGARTLSWGWSPVTTLIGVCVVGIVATAVITPGLLRPEPATIPTGTRDGATARRSASPYIWALAVLALMLMLCEGVANDWSAIEARDVLGTPAATAAFAYGAYAAAMTIGRLVTDRISARFGPVAVVRNGAFLAAAALAVVALSGSVPLTIVGWAAYGIGLSGCIPQLFSAAGHSDQAAAGVNVARVSSLGYLGMLAGPAIIGPLTRLIPLNLALLLPVALCVVAGVAARIVRPRGAMDTEATTGGTPPAEAELAAI